MLRTILIYVVLTCLSVMAGPSEPTQLALKVIQQQESSIASLLKAATPVGKRHYLSYFNYMEQLRTNWTDTLNAPVRDIPQNLRPLAETFKCYFAGGASLDKPDVNALLHPPWPLSLDATNFSSEEWRRIQISDIQIRVAWFNMLSQLQSKTFLENNPASMMTVSLALQHLDELYVNGLNKLLTPADFETMFLHES